MDLSIFVSRPFLFAEVVALFSLGPFHFAFHIYICELGSQIQLYTIVWGSLHLPNKQFSDSENIYGGAETKNEFQGEIGTELWTSLWDGEVREASISMNNKWMDESDVSASVLSSAEYIPYFSLMLDNLVSTSIDANTIYHRKRLYRIQLYI